MTDMSRYACIICGESFPRRELFPCGAIRGSIAKRILGDRPTWGQDDFICKHDLIKSGADYVHFLLESEKGELTSIEQKVLHSIQEHELLAMNVDKEFENRWSFGERLADGIARFGGSWTFILCFGTFIAIWIVINILVLRLHPPDPYPFILLNLILSCLAAIQAPIIMMSQNRQEAKDRLRLQHEYQINLKAELEIRHLHDKLDHLLSHQWDRLVQIQELQLDLLSAMFKRK
ncbi:MAG: DUF1003 domain-containing protein [Desulfobacteraceae bacterium]|nr:MAG: DUF1003 domain-containing protein [Desulfobacteraceae bacterium]